MYRDNHRQSDDEGDYSEEHSAEGWDKPYDVHATGSSALLFLGAILGRVFNCLTSHVVRLRDAIKANKWL